MKEYKVYSLLSTLIDTTTINTIGTMECFTCGKSYASWQGLAYHKGAVHGITNGTYLTTKNRKRRERLMNNLKENKVANQEEVVVDELSEVEYQFQGYITGFFHYRHHWTPKIGEKLTTYPDKDNAYDAYAVNVIKDQKTTVGHVPRQLSKAMTDLLNSGGCITVTVTDYPVLMKREGMRVPCQYKVHGMNKLVYDIRRNTEKLR